MEPPTSAVGLANLVEVADQLSALRSVRLLVGAHGAGLVNLLFLDETASAVEIQPTRDWEHVLC